MGKTLFFWRLKWLLILLIMVIIDIGPFPFTALILFSIFIYRPIWFKKLIDKLYANKP
jgi:hypothetical protein